MPAGWRRLKTTHTDWLLPELQTVDDKLQSVKRHRTATESLCWYCVIPIFRLVRYSRDTTCYAPCWRQCYSRSTEHVATMSNHQSPDVDSLTLKALVRIAPGKRGTGTVSRKPSGHAREQKLLGSVLTAVLVQAEDDNSSPSCSARDIHTIKKEEPIS